MDSSAAPPGPADDGADASSGAQPAASQDRDPQGAAVTAPVLRSEPRGTGADPHALDEEALAAPGALLSAEEREAALALRDREAAAAPEVAPPPAAIAVPETPYWPSNWFMGIVAFLVAAADIGSKEWAKHALAGPDLKRTGKHIEVIPNYLDFIFAQNPGGAWSFLRGVPDGLRRPFFLFVSAAAIVFIVMVYQRLERRQWAMRWGLPLALGGALGNLADRVRYGWVVDFIDVYWKGNPNEVHWPTFNVADIAIVIGVGLMAMDLLSLRKMKDPDPQPAAEAAGGAA